MAAGKDYTERLVDVPMAGNARESVKNAKHTSTMDYGITDDGSNFEVNTARNVSEADRLDRAGYEGEGLNIHTGRLKTTKYTGHK